MDFWNKAKIKTRDWFSLLDKRRSFNEIDFSETVDDSLVKDGIILIVGPKDNLKWVKFKCPCHCGAIISLNLMKSYYPRWTIKELKENKITINPSVASTTCQSHFWVRKNKIFWIFD